MCDAGGSYVNRIGKGDEFIGYSSLFHGSYLLSGNRLMFWFSSGDVLTFERG